MYNLHCHSLSSDGELLPSEVAMRHLALGYKVIAVTDHADYSNIDTAINSILVFCRHWPASQAIKVLPGIELTHLPLDQFKPLAEYARQKGVKIIVGHGQTPMEPVAEGTNRAALEADIDILAHPGMINDEDARLAFQKGIFLEITSRKSHSSANSYVVKQARKFRAKLILNTDGHAPEDIITPAALRKIGIKAGLTDRDIDGIYEDVTAFLEKSVHS